MNNPKLSIFHRVRNQIVVLMILLTVLPISVVQLVNYSRTSELLMDRNREIVEDNLVLSARNASDIISDYKQILFQLSTDSTFSNALYLKNNNANDNNEKTPYAREIEDAIRINILLYPEVQAVGIIDTNNDTQLYIEERSSTEQIGAYFYDNFSEISSGLDSDNKPRVGATNDNSVNYSDNPFFYIASKTYDHERMKLLGTIILFINPSRLNDSLNNSDSYTHDYINKIVVNNSGDIISDKHQMIGNKFENTDIGRALNEGILGDESSVTIDQQDYFVSRTSLGIFDLELISVTNYTQLNSNISSLWKRILVIILAILLITLMLAYIIIWRFTIPIEKISRLMNTVNEHNLDVKIEVNTQNEFKEIEISFNNLIKQVKDLLTKNKEHMQEVIAANNKACVAEIKSLELQINPHFLFNTLDTINWTASKENNLEVSNQISKLASILRHTVYGLNEQVSVEKEIEWIRNYLDLQKNRYHNKFNYYIYAEANTLNLKIHKLITQPFLENSIIHGFEGINYTGIITIEIRTLKAKYLLIRLTDNGIGISIEEVNAINKCFSSMTDFSNGIGISNIAYRLNNYYKNTIVRFSSSKSGTCIRIFIPMEELNGR